MSFEQEQVFRYDGQEQTERREYPPIRFPASLQWKKKSRVKNIFIQKSKPFPVIRRNITGGERKANMVIC